jgi:hypothetical protein
LRGGAKNHGVENEVKKEIVNWKMALPWRGRTPDRFSPLSTK